MGINISFLHHEGSSEKALTQPAMHVSTQTESNFNDERQEHLE